MSEPWEDWLHTTKFTCPRCGDPISTNGYLFWCENGHLWAIEQDGIKQSATVQ